MDETAKKEMCDLYALVEKSLDETEEEFADYFKSGNSVLNAIRSETIEKFIEVFLGNVRWNIQKPYITVSK